MTLTPAYGRDYNSKTAVMADFLANKDFTANSFDDRTGYTNRADLIGIGIKQVSIRYKRNTMQMIVKIK